MKRKYHNATNHSVKDISPHTFIEMGIMMEQRSSNRRGMTSNSYHGPSFGYWTYHSYKMNKNLQSDTRKCTPNKDLIDLKSLLLECSTINREKAKTERGKTNLIENNPSSKTHYTISFYRQKC